MWEDAVTALFDTYGKEEKIDNTRLSGKILEAFFGR